MDAIATTKRVLTVRGAWSPVLTVRDVEWVDAIVTTKRALKERLPPRKPRESRRARVQPTEGWREADVTRGG